MCAGELTLLFSLKGNTEWLERNNQRTTSQRAHAHTQSHKAVNNYLENNSVITGKHKRTDKREREWRTRKEWKNMTENREQWRNMKSCVGLWWSLQCKKNKYVYVINIYIHTPSLALAFCHIYKEGTAQSRVTCSQLRFTLWKFAPTLSEASVWLCVCVSPQGHVFFVRLSVVAREDMPTDGRETGWQWQKIIDTHMLQQDACTHMHMETLPF